ncbi:FlgB family protein [Celeribacter halophilus]|uniref:Flagellar basal body rod protein FlgB n=1 Tax=Celeribacter halophilus TaxID=576117 RepID=A0A1I3UML0_9RHOB|nr:FlgB family protein [Celeribacter halophilus]PZX10069.1 flagellar basal-body rod protein FlgB [Celeribacter halophilus]SFJ84698.1 flagellar basal-body rod protein FlgB [Celeribacter halophilus]
MFENLEIFKMAGDMARHAVTRQEVIAKNIANADTPEYRAKDIAPFARTYEQASGTTMRATRAAHILAPKDAAMDYGVFETSGTTSPNGNTVSLETEMMKSSQVRHEHDLALAIYKSSMNILRTSIGRA